MLPAVLYIHGGQKQLLLAYCLMESSLQPVGHHVVGEGNTGVGWVMAVNTGVGEIEHGWSES